MIKTPNHNNTINGRFSYREMTLIKELFVFEKHLRLLRMVYNGKEGKGTSILRTCQSIASGIQELSTHQQSIYSHVLNREYTNSLPRR